MGLKFTQKELAEANANDVHRWMSEARSAGFSEGVASERRRWMELCRKGMDPACAQTTITVTLTEEVLADARLLP